MMRRDPHVMSDFPDGHVLAGRYRLGALLGRGGRGAVYKALDLRLDRPVAIKIVQSVSPATAADGSISQEARALARLSHPNVVAVYDVGQADDYWFLVTEYVEGRSLGEILRERQPIDQSRAVEIVTQIGEALAYLHSR